MTDVAVQGLNGMDLGDQALKVQRASIGVSQAAGLEMGVNAMSLLAGSTSADLAESRVLQLLNMVTAEDLINDDDYQGKSDALFATLAHNTQISWRTSKRSVRNMEMFLKLRFLDHQWVADNRPALARSSLSLRTMLLQTLPWQDSLVGNLITGRSSRRSSLRSSSKSMLGSMEEK